MTATETCACGHVYDEHDNGGPCLVVLWRVPPLGRDEPCTCVHFDAAGDEDDEL